MQTADLEIRPLTDEEMPTALTLLSMLFAEPASDDGTARERLIWEAERSLGAFDGDTLVGCMSTYSHDLSVPGATTPAAGTTWVAVSPTHRRQGLLRRMMTRHLNDIADRGEAYAALWASEASIYGRFGYGPAIGQVRMTLHTAGLSWSDTAPNPDAAIRFVSLDDAPAVLTPIYEAARARRAGLHARDEGWWRFQTLATDKSCMMDAANKQVAVASIDGQDAAYAVYGLADGAYISGRPGGQVKVIEMAGVDPAAEAVMWRFLANHDLTASVFAPRRPVDDALPLLVSDQRRVERTLSDALHVRVIDVPAALRARSYTESAGFTMEISDGMLEANEGTWRVEVAPEGASVEPVSPGGADLAMDISALGALSMGDVRVRHLAAAGRIEVANPDVIPAVDAAFASTEAGWAPEVW